MRRKSIRQLMNQPWYPGILKKLTSEFLSWFVVKVNATEPFAPIIEDLLIKTGKRQIVNIDFGIGAGVETIAPMLDRNIHIVSVPVSEFSVELEGLYLFANSFHQMDRNRAGAILRDIAQTGNPVVIVEGNNDSLWQIFGMTIFVPLTVLLTAPLVRPFRLSRLILTYLLPVLPIAIALDGCIALLKLYNPEDLRELTTSIQIQNYRWEMGKRNNGRGGKIIYLTGWAL